METRLYHSRTKLNKKLYMLITSFGDQLKIKPHKILKILPSVKGQYLDFVSTNYSPVWYSLRQSYLNCKETPPPKKKQI